MKSSGSIITDSIENQSLPSIPFDRETRTKQKNRPRNSHSRVSTPVSSRLTYFQRSFANTSSKTPELNKISEFAVLKVYEHGSFGKSPSAYSKVSEDLSAPNLPKCRSSVYNRPIYLMPSSRPVYYKMDSFAESDHKSDSTGCIFLPKLLPSEVEFIRLVTENSVSAAAKYLEDHPSLNINCTNFQGISPLHMAVRNRSEEMVEFLLKNPRTEIGDTVLHAVRDNTINILVTLLEAQKKISPGLEFAGATHSTIFPSHITPLILAAQLNNYELVKLLLTRGHSITAPHPPTCDCVSCKTCMMKEDGLHASSARLAVYRAVCSPAYLVHVCADPVLESFRLSEELAANAACYRHLAAEYMQLQRAVREFAVGLIESCRSSSEVEVLVRQVAGCEGRRQFVLPRLLLAVCSRQWEFVAHPHTQQVLESYWLGDWFSWRGKSFLAKVSVVFRRIFMLPFILLFCVLLPSHRVTRHYQIPLNKLISHTASYLVFLALVFHISNQDKSKLPRGPPDTGAEGPLILYVCGYTWSAVRMCFMQGPRRFLTTMWNWAEVIMLTLFWCTFWFWALAAVEADDDKKSGGKPALERKYWKQYDPTLVAEGTFCLATIFAFLRLMFLCQLSYHLGPLQVSLGKMTLDIYKYVLVFAIIMSAFAAGLARFYQYYDGMVYEDQHAMKTVQVSSFTSLRDTLNTLFWALFCMAPLESADIVMENTRNATEKGLPVENRHGYTERVGYFCFGCFEVISVIVVLNMLIATMSNTFQRVTDNVAIEWTFAKTEVYIEYMWQTTLPPPWNLVPTAAGVAGVADWARARLCAATRLRARCSPAHCCYMERDVEANIQKEFPALMSVLVQRYFSNCESEHSQLDFIQQELNTIKETVLKKTTLPENNNKV